MNRDQRRKQTSPNKTSRKTGLTYLTVAGVVGGAIGLPLPAQAAPALITNCTELETALNNASANGGTINANFSDTCDFAEGFIFGGETTITGPTNGNLTLRFTGDRGSTPDPSDYYADGFTAVGALNVSNVNFSRPSGSLGFDYYISGWSTLTISNSTFSGAELSAAIYVEGNLTVSDSKFENLDSYLGGAAIYAKAYTATEITNSTFFNNKALGQASGGAINTEGTLDISNSTFDSNQAGYAGGAIVAGYPVSRVINNSTFVGNAAMEGAAISLSEGGLISNSTFWNNGDSDTYSIYANTSDTYFFANILANDTPNTVKVIDPDVTTTDLGANLYTDSGFDDTTTGDGESKLVTLAELKLNALSLNQTGPTNTGSTKTVSIGAGSVAENYYTASSAGAQEGITRNNLAATDQRGVARTIGAGYDVGAFELGEHPDEEVVPEEAKTSISKKTITFAPGSSKLTAASKKKLRALAAQIQDKELTKVNLQGYTATFTKAAPAGRIFRVKLSRSRVAAVEKYLKLQFKKNGYAVTFTKSAKGAANRVKSNKTESGRKYNRRVEIVIK